MGVRAYGTLSLWAQRPKPINGDVIHRRPEEYGPGDRTACAIRIDADKPSGARVNLRATLIIVRSNANDRRIRRRPTDRGQGRIGKHDRQGNGALTWTNLGKGGRVPPRDNALQGRFVKDGTFPIDVSGHENRGVFTLQRRSIKLRYATLVQRDAVDGRFRPFSCGGLPVAT
jgi:hypothetical protein